MKKQYKNTSSESLQTDWKSGFESPESRPCFPDWAEWRCKTGRTSMSNGRSERAKQPFRAPHYGRLAAFLGHQKRLRIFKRLTDSTLTPALKSRIFGQESSRRKYRKHSVPFRIISLTNRESNGRQSLQRLSAPPSFDRFAQFADHTHIRQPRNNHF